MTVEFEVPTNTFNMNNQTEAQLDYYIENKENITVTKNGVLVSPLEYTVTSLKSYLGGRVIFNTPITGVIVVKRHTSVDRSFNYNNTLNNIKPESLNNDFDRIWRSQQEQDVALADEALIRLNADLDLQAAIDQEEAARIAGDLTLRQYAESLAYVSGVTDDANIKVTQPFTGAITRTQHDKNLEFISVKDFGAVGDGITDDTLAIQRAIDAAGAGGSLYFPEPSLFYKTSYALKFLNQNWIGQNGVDVIGDAVEIRLTATSTSVAESKNPASVCYGFSAKGIYFNAQGFAPVGLSLYNSSYCDIEACGANTTASGGAAILFDSDTSKQCYFNIVKNCRVFAANGVGFRFTRGANVNQIIGGKCGGSVRGAEFFSMSAGNMITGTDFEGNTDCHIYCDATNNVFLGVHMEDAPIGYYFTVNGWNNRRFGSTFASTVTQEVVDLSKSAAVLDCYSDGSGELKYSNFRSKASFLSTLLRVENELISLNGAEGVLFSYFRNLNTSSANKRVVYYKGDGTATESFAINLATAEVQFGDLTQKSSTGLQRKIIRAAEVPTTGANGDLVLRTNTSAALPVAAWTCTNASGTYAASSWIVQKSATRPTLTAIDVGVMHLDTNLAANGKPIWWTGTTWVDATGATV